MKNVYEIITETKQGKKLSDEEIRYLVDNYVSGEIPDYQMSAWLMAVCINGLTEQETFALTMAMCESGEKLNLSKINGITADKHSTGGVGDKTSLIIAPIVAACGVYMPKMSGRGLGHTGGTIDKLESIPNFKSSLEYNEFIEHINKTGFSIISQSGYLVPADKKIYALRDTTATVDSIPLICSSIMSKKLATNADCILLDVKTGSGAFMKTQEKAEELARLMVKVGERAGKRCRAIISDMNAPLGRAVGNSLEVIEAIDILKGKEKGTLYDLCIEISANILQMCGKGNIEKCETLAEEAIINGSALECFRKTIELQGGDIRAIDDYSLFLQPKYTININNEKAGYISAIDSEQIGLVSLALGAGRLTKDTVIDLSAGILLNKSIGEYVEKGETLLTLYTSKEMDCRSLFNQIHSAYQITDTRPDKFNVIKAVIDN